MINIYYILSSKCKKTKKYELHEVIQNEHKWTCTCISFLTSKGKDCKHIKQIKDERVR